MRRLTSNSVGDHNRRMSGETEHNDADVFTSPKPHHVSDVDTWQKPDLNYFVFVVLTFLFGFIGLDHMYLRSNGTAFKKLLLNVFGLGIWYVWDIIQVLKDGKLVRQHGLNSPFDWIRGIGRGMFKPIPADLSKEEARKQGKGPQYAAPKSFFIYSLLAICLGIFGADKFYLGNNWQGMAKIFSVFNIFLFLFGILWVLWDAVHAYFMTESILEKGIAPPIPFSWVFKPISADIFKVVEVKETPEDDGGFLSRLPIPSIPALPWRDLYRELVVPVLQPTVGTAVQNANKVVSIGTKVVGLGTTALAAGPGFVGNLASQVGDQAVQQASGTSIDAVQQAAAQIAATRQATSYTGGGYNRSHNNISQEGGGPGPILAGAFTALILAGGLKGFYDFFSKQVN